MNKALVDAHQHMLSCTEGHDEVRWRAKSWRGVGPHGIVENCAYDDQLSCFVCGKMNTKLTSLGTRPKEEADENSGRVDSLEKQATTKEGT